MFFSSASPTPASPIIPPHFTPTGAVGGSSAMKLGQYESTSKMGGMQRKGSSSRKLDPLSRLLERDKRIAAPVVTMSMMRRMGRMNSEDDGVVTGGVPVDLCSPGSQGNEPAPIASPEPYESPHSTARLQARMTAMQHELEKERRAKLSLERQLAGTKESAARREIEFEQTRALELMKVREALEADDVQCQGEVVVRPSIQNRTMIQNMKDTLEREISALRSLQEEVLHKDKVQMEAFEEERRQWQDERRRLQQRLAAALGHGSL